MAASLLNTHARVSLDLINVDRENCWFLLVYSELPTINDVALKIAKQNELTLPVTLHLKECLLPGWERSLLIKDEDKITVSVRQDETHSEQTFDNVNIPQPQTDRKRKKKKKEKERANVNDDCQSSLDTDNLLCSSKRKRKRRHSEQTQEVCTVIAAEDPINSVVSKKSDKRETVTDTDGSGSGISKPVDNFHADQSETADAEMELNQCINAEVEEPVKKRKRIRKHRKRNKAPLDTNSSNSVCEGQKTLKQKTEDCTYKGRQVNEDELFFGSIPDKLVNPKHYRHGYRNLKVYQPVPNSHQLFKSDDEEENEIQKGTEQYNFLSSTKILEDREQSISDNETNSTSYTSYKPDVHSHNDYSEQNNLNSCQPEHLSKADIYQDKTNAFLEGANDQGSKLLNTPGSKNDSWNKTPIKESTRLSPYAPSSLTDTSNQNERIPIESMTVNTEDAVHSSPGSCPSPSTLTRKMLPNGVSVFVRQRANRKSHSGQPIRELSKEEQLNTTASNKSTVFKVPQSQSPYQPRSQSVQPKAKSPSVQPNSPDVKNQAMPIQPSQQLYKSTPPRAPVVEKYPVTKIATNGSEPTAGSHSTDYNKLVQLKGKPEVGMVIAYRVLEMSLSCTPEVSAYKEAEVLAVDSTDMVTLKNISPDTELKYNKFHVEIEDDDGVLTSTTKEQEQITVHASSLLETRVIKQP